MAHLATRLDLERLLADGAWLRALSHSLLHGSPEADDAVQEVWAAALRSPPSRDRPTRPWLAEVLRNVVRSAARQTRARREREDADATQRARQRVPSPEDVLARMQTLRRVAEQVIALDEPYRATLLLRYYDGHRAVDIARAQSLPEGTVRWRINEGLRRLRDRLDRLSSRQGMNWRRALLPFAMAKRGRGSGERLPLQTPGLLLTGVVTLLGALTVGAVWRHGPRSSSDFVPGAVDLERSDTPDTSDRLRAERLKEAAKLFGVAIPALTSAAAEANAEDVVVAGCLRMHEKSYECKDAFIEAILDAQLVATESGPLTSAERQRVHDVRLAAAEDEEARPLEQRRAACREWVKRFPKGTRVAYAKQRPLAACYQEQDCGVRARCFVSVLSDVGELLESSPEASSR